MPVVVGTSGLAGAELEELDALALERSLQLLVVPVAYLLFQKFLRNDPTAVGTKEMAQAICAKLKK